MIGDTFPLVGSIGAMEQDNKKLQEWFYKKRREVMVRVFGLCSEGMLPCIIFLGEVNNERHENHIEIARRFKQAPMSRDYDGICLCYGERGMSVYSRLELMVR